MSFFHEPAIVHPKCQSKKRRIDDTVSCQKSHLKVYPKQKLAQTSSVFSIVRTSLSWAGDTLHTYRDGFSKEERKKRMDIENRKQVLYSHMRNAMSYGEWRSCACELDVLEDNDAWKETVESTEYNFRLVKERLRQLEEARASCDVSRMLFLIRTTLTRDLGNMSDASLYRHSHVGTKNLIDQYITAAVDTISTLVNLSERKRCDDVELKYILDQLLAARQAFGRSALLFSGGATFGMNHIGVLKSLWEAKLLPRIISGSSAGSIVSSVFCTRTEDELPALLDTFAHGDFAVFNETGQEENILQKVARFLKYGSWVDSSHLARAMRTWLGDITFQEAYNRTRRILNICVSSASVYELPRLLNYITSPNVLIWSAVAVSCSVPLVFSPYVLMAKDPLTGEPVPWNDLHRQYIDGSVENDLPMTRLSEMFNVNHFIVSQVNPHVLPFLSKDESPRSDAKQNSPSNPGWLHIITHLAKDEALHRMTVLSELGIFPTFLTKAVAVVSQKYFGDITIFPEVPYTSFPLILKNPTIDFILKACLGGERATWPKLGRIRNHLAIELALDSAIQTMRARVAFCSTDADLTVSGGFVHRPVAPYGIDSGRGRRPPQRRSSSYSHKFGKLREVESFQMGSHRLQKSGMTRKSTPSFEQPYGLSSLNDYLRMEECHAAGLRSSIQPIYAGRGTFVVESDNSDDSIVSFPRRPGFLIQRASWGPPSYDCISDTKKGWQDSLSFYPRRSSSSFCQRRSSSTGTVIRDSKPSGEFLGATKATSHSSCRSCRKLDMASTTGTSLADPTVL